MTLKLCNSFNVTWVTFVNLVGKNRILCLCHHILYDKIHYKVRIRKAGNFLNLWIRSTNRG